MIEAQGLCKKFKRKGRLILDHLDLAIPSGDRIALVGANGAGKTTLIRVLLGEYRYDGKVSVFGNEPRSHRCENLRRVGFVPQLPPPLKMPVSELLRFSARISDSKIERMEEIATRLFLRLDEVRRQPFAKLSGGQKQKVLISIALGRESEVLILDEPAANLDPEARAVLFDLLAEKRSAAMIISSHRIDEVSSLVNRVVELDFGRLILDERLKGSDELGTRLACKLRVTRDEEAFLGSLREWGFSPVNGAGHWQGTVQAADRLRFLGMIARYSGLVEDFSLSKGGKEGEIDE